jgi:hypothetical protein
MSLSAKFTKYISEEKLNSSAIKRLIRLDPSLLSIPHDSGTLLMHLVDRGFDFDGCGDLTFQVLQSLNHPEAYGDNLKTFQSMLNPSVNLIIDFIDEDMEEELIRLIAHTDARKIRKVFPKVMEKRCEKILSFETFSLNSFDDETIKKIRIRMADPPEILFKNYRVDIDEINLRKMNPRLEILYENYGKGTIRLSECESDSEYSEDSDDDDPRSDREKWDLIKNVFNDEFYMNDRVKNEIYNRYMHYLGRCFLHKNFRDPQMAKIRALNFAFKGFNVDFSKSNTERLRGSIIMYSVYWDKKTIAPKCVLDEIEKLGLDFLINASFRNRNVVPFLKMIINQKREYRFNMKYFEFLYDIFGTDVLYLLNSCPSYKDLMILSPDMRMFFVLKISDGIGSFRSMDLDLLWLNHPLISNLISKMIKYVFDLPSDIIQIAFTFINFALKFEEYETIGYIISQDFPNTKSEIEEKIVRKITNLFFYASNDLLIVSKYDHDIAKANEIRNGLLINETEQRARQTLLRFYQRTH